MLSQVRLTSRPKGAPLVPLDGNLALAAPGPADWPSLKARGIGAVVDLGDAAPGRAAAARGSGLRYLALPVGPEHLPLRGELYVAISWLEKRAAEGTSGLIADPSGRDSDCMLAMALLIGRGWEFERAYERMRRVRAGFGLAAWQSRALLLHLAQQEAAKA